jgi:hypothetical protein
LQSNCSRDPEKPLLRVIGTAKSRRKLGNLCPGDAKLYLETAMKVSTRPSGVSQLDMELFGINHELAELAEQVQEPVLMNGKGRQERIMFGVPIVTLWAGIAIALLHVFSLFLGDLNMSGNLLAMQRVLWSLFPGG